jgi:integrase
MASVAKRGARWFAQVRKQGISKSKTFSRKLEAVEWASALERELESTGGRFRERLTMRSLMEDYVRDVAPGKRTAYFEHKCIARFQECDFAQLDVSAVTTDDIGRYRDAVLKTCTPATAIRYMTVLSSIFEYARRDRSLIQTNPVRDARKPKQSPHRERLPTEYEIERLLTCFGYEYTQKVYTNSQQVAVALLLSVETAMRAGELLGLTWCHVDTIKRVAHLPRTKNGTSRDVPLSTEALRLIKQLEGLDALRLFTITECVRDCEFRRARKIAGIVDLHFHDSRALALTRLSKQLDVLELARMVGHRDPRSLMIYYRESAENIAKKLK